MELIDDKIRDKIACNGFTLRELLAFKKAINSSTHSSARINKKKLHEIIYTTAKKSLRDVTIAFFGVLFLQIPFLASVATTGFPDLPFMVTGYVLQTCMIFYITAKVNKTSACTQFKLAKLAIRCIFIIRL